MVDQPTIDRFKMIRFREARGLTQGQLALKAGVAQAHLSRLESGDRVDLKLSTLNKIARALGVRPQDLMPGLSEDDLPDFHMYISRKFADNPRLRRALIAAYEALESVREERGERVRGLDEEIERTRRKAEERKKQGEGPGEG
ncbi:MAG: helix-turn-helix domain-containing protein [Dehalococcoidales bacterium]|nr:helix-turn-helix domain-containing protein [Dehalococcoidales bacterium]